MTTHANTAPMNWDLAIERNREALLRILVALLAMLPDGNATTQITRRLHSATCLCCARQNPPSGV